MTTPDPRALMITDLGVVQEPPNEVFDLVLRLAGRVFDVPVVAVNLLDGDSQFTIATLGGKVGVVPRRLSLCATVVDTGEPLVISDSREDRRFRDHPAVLCHPEFRFYAGAPLKSGGQNVGALCMVDARPREFDASDVRLLTQLAAWLERGWVVEQDLEQVAEVQRCLLPSRAPAVPGLEAAGRCVSASNAGGDFFDWQVIDGRLQVTLVDVMGKGIASALIAAHLRATVRGACRYTASLAEAVASIARAVEDDLEEAARFVTLFVARIDPRDATVEYVDAGHGLAQIAAEHRPPRRLTSANLPIGVAPDERWEAKADRLAEDESLLVISDGVVEGFPDSATALERVGALAASHLGPEELVDRVIGLTADLDVEDDITAVAVRRNLTGESG